MQRYGSEECPAAFQMPDVDLRRFMTLACHGNFQVQTSDHIEVAVYERCVSRQYALRRAVLLFTLLLHQGRYEVVIRLKSREQEPAKVMQPT